ncbi:MAG: TMEM165/GDT1 family protein [Planctomycetota bacterium]|jgi:putative Ca2+/H+ antiporter (TMEM165/GDT1 family)|nr:TMEM165/GDT1 family protein [Planctomycetota bacterium]
MEWWKLFGGTFVLVFLAELGDKTQLAALAKTAESPDDPAAKWAVFLGATLALGASTLIAVFLGQALRATIPDERYIKLASGGLFLFFGIMILRDVWKSL